MHTTLRPTTTLGMADVTQIAGLIIMSQNRFPRECNKPAMKLSSLESIWTNTTRIKFLSDTTNSSAFTATANITTIRWMRTECWSNTATRLTTISRMLSEIDRWIFSRAETQRSRSSQCFQFHLHTRLSPQKKSTRTLFTTFPPRERKTLMSVRNHSRSIGWWPWSPLNCRKQLLARLTKFISVDLKRFKRLTI